MNEDLKHIKAGLEKVEAGKNHRKQLAAEQGELQVKIQRLTADVAAGKAKSVADLTIAKARLESALPADLSRSQAESAAVIADLRSTLAGLGPQVARVYGAKREEIQASVEKFLGEHLDAGHEFDELARKITNESRSVRSLESLSTIFHSTATIHSMGEQSVINRCSHALRDLADVI